MKDRVHVTAKKRRKKKLYSKLSIITNQYDNSMYYYNFIAVSAHGQLNANLLATRVGKLFEIARLDLAQAKNYVYQPFKVFLFFTMTAMKYKKAAEDRAVKTKEMKTTLVG